MAAVQFKVMMTVFPYFFFDLAAAAAAGAPARGGVIGRELEFAAAPPGGDFLLSAGFKIYSSHNKVAIKLCDHTGRQSSNKRISEIKLGIVQQLCHRI
ncbi:hypothetical protein BV898_00964 [Hypsibius exemplaris]|uniref:Uncharacterized protein n=1 Tax=Hypsibius exemplaris TaxID=2072580 RepID=A0A1W0XCU9_HYPEX|nr:hypothetical protein BV898_00964 [Hypsibius exemplaris]